MVRIALSTGHSQKDKGAIAIDGSYEYEYNVALVGEMIHLGLGIDAEWYLADALAENLPYPQHLRKTVDVINASGAVACCEIHHNANRNSNVARSEIIFWDTSSRSQHLAKCIQHEMKIVRPDTRVFGNIAYLGEKRKKYFLHATKCPAVIIEPTYLTNQEDWVMTVEKMSEFAHAICYGVQNWLREANIL